MKEFFCKAESEDFNKKPQQLKQAIKNQDLDEVMLLLEDTDIEAKDRGIALRDSSSSGYLELVKLLLKDPLINKLHKCAALNKAAENKHSGIVDLLILEDDIPEEDKQLAIQKLHGKTKKIPVNWLAEQEKNSLGFFETIEKGKAVSILSYLSSNKITKEILGLALAEACEKGDKVLAGYLLKKEILDKDDKLWAKQVALRFNHTDIVDSIDQNLHRQEHLSRDCEGADKIVNFY